MPLRATVGLAAAVLAAVGPAVAGCGGTAPAPTPATTTATPADPACPSLYARLQRVTAAITSGSELIAGSANPQDLAQRIVVQQGQLERSADLMAAAPVPAAVADADRRMVAALRAFAADFGRARVPAARGDFQAASQAMSDPDVTQRILGAAQEIENACKPA